MTSLLSADDLNDFIAPGVACIKEEAPENEHNSKHIQLEFEFDPSGEVIEKSSKKKLSKAQISLTDCLACSGCITSMEEVLVAQHSHGEFLKALNNEENNDRIWVLSLSQQARASLASAFNVPISYMDSALAKIFIEHFNFNYVVSVNVGREITNREVNNEAHTTIKENKGPLLLSVCPGWVLYVEKTHPELVDSMSKVKSPQGITGGLLSTLLGPNVYHLSIMPCFDKKLEAARDKEVVDCVITPKEVILMFEERGIDLNGVLNGIDPTLRIKWTPKGWFEGNDYGWGGNFGSSSGGYAFEYLVERQRLNEQSEIKIIKGRNNDIYELQLITLNGEVISRTGVVNGFKNIQNLVRKLKPDTTDKPVSSLLARRRRGKAGGGIDPEQATVDLSKCEILEIMACPQGCINGGGQIKAPEGTLNDTWIESVREKYQEAESGKERMGVYEWFEAVCLTQGIDKNSLLRMEVKAVEKVKDDPMEMFTSTW